MAGLLIFDFHQSQEAEKIKYNPNVKMYYKFFNIIEHIPKMKKKTELETPAESGG